MLDKRILMIQLQEFDIVVKWYILNWGDNHFGV